MSDVKSKEREKQRKRAREWDLESKERVKPPSPPKSKPPIKTPYPPSSGKKRTTLGGGGGSAQVASSSGSDSSHHKKKSKVNAGAKGASASTTTTADSRPPKRQKAEKSIAEQRAAAKEWSASQAKSDHDSMEVEVEDDEVKDPRPRTSSRPVPRADPIPVSRGSNRTNYGGTSQFASIAEEKEDHLPPRKQPVDRLPAARPAPRPQRGMLSLMQTPPPPIPERRMNVPHQPAVCLAGRFDSNVVPREESRSNGTFVGDAAASRPSSPQSPVGGLLRERVLNSVERRGRPAPSAQYVPVASAPLVSMEDRQRVEQEAAALAAERERRNHVSSSPPPAPPAIAPDMQPQELQIHLPKSSRRWCYIAALLVLAAAVLVGYLMNVTGPHSADEVIVTAEERVCCEYKPIDELGEREGEDEVRLECSEWCPTEVQVVRENEVVADVIRGGMLTDVTTSFSLFTYAMQERLSNAKLSTIATFRAHMDALSLWAYTSAATMADLGQKVVASLTFLANTAWKGIQSAGAEVGSFIVGAGVTVVKYFGKMGWKWLKSVFVAVFEAFVTHWLWSAPIAALCMTVFFVDRRRGRNYQRSVLATTMLNAALENLWTQKQASPDHPHVSVVHLQDFALDLVGLHSAGSKKRKEFLADVWPLVEKQVKSESRIRRSTRTYYGQPNVMSWEWIPVTAVPVLEPARRPWLLFRSQ